MSDASWTIEHHQETTSTNDLAKAVARQGAVDRTVVVAARQSAGRGRSGNAWASPPGGLYASVILRDVSTGLAPLLPLAAGEAMVRTIGALRLDVPSWLKWPNDLLVAAPGEADPRGKAGGVIVESVSRGARLDHAVVGFGVNLQRESAGLPTDADPPAVALGALAGKRIDPTLFLDVLLSQLAQLLVAYRRSPERLVPVVERRLAWKDAEVRVERTDGAIVTGRLLGLTADGALRLATEMGEAVLSGWDVRHLRRAQ